MAKKSVLALCSMALLTAAFPLPASAQNAQATEDSKIQKALTSDAVQPPFEKYIWLDGNIFVGVSGMGAAFWAAPCSYFPNEPCFEPVAGQDTKQGSIPFGQQFKASSNYTVDEVVVPVQWSGVGTRGFELSIYSDNSGLPGTLLLTEQAVAKTTYPACCTLADAVTVKFPQGLALTEGTPYWVVVDADPYPSTQDVWPTVVGPFATNTNGAWVSGTGPLPAAFELFGTISSNFTISASPSSVTVAPGSNGTTTITTAAENGFDSAITLSASGQPNGVTATFSPNPIPAPGSGTSTLTLAVSPSTAPGTYEITVTGAGGGESNATTVSLTVT